MRKSIYIFGLVILINSNLFSQSNWMFHEPSPTGNNLNSVFFINDSKGWIAGDNGTILKYNNSLFTQSYITSDPLNSIFFISENTGWTAGGSGKIFKTTDGGSNWLAQSSSTLNLLTSIRFATPDTGWAVGINGTILKTVNGGNSWIPQQSSFNDTLKTCFCVSPLTCYAAGKNGTILFTSDGGSNWNYQSTGINNFLNSIHFINQNTGWVAGNGGRILKTTNGGSSWDIVPSLSAQNCYSIFFKSADTGSVATLDKLYSTVNGGQTWSEFFSIPFTNFFKSLYITDSFQWCVGVLGQIHKSTNAGLSWSRLSSMMNVYCYNEYRYIFFNNGLTGWILHNIPGRLGCEQGNILKTTNGGVNWINHISYPDGYLLSIFSAGNNYWAVLNGGITSNGAFIPSPGGYLYSVTNQFACGENGTILRITGAGSATTVTSLNSNTTGTLFGIHSSGGNVVYAAGSNGTIVRSTNFGADWNIIPTGTNADLFSIRVAFEVGYAVGDSGTILKTTDAGESWTELNSGVINYLTSVAFPVSNNPVTAYITGYHGIILKTTNEGDTWNSEHIGKDAALTSISFRNSSTGFITGGVNGRSLLLSNSNLNSNVNLNLKILIEGFYNNISNYMVSDSVKIFLRNASPPYSIADSSGGVISNAGETDLTFTNSVSQGYYIQAKQRNSIETWSSVPVAFNASSVAYDFTSSQSRAYGNNLTLKGSKWTVFSGDVNNDGIVDVTDLLNVYNDGLAGLTGYIITDLNGDNVVDLSDLLICYNNSGKFVTVIKP